MGSETKYKRSRSILLNFLWQRFNGIITTGSNSKLPGRGTAGGFAQSIAFLKINHQQVTAAVITQLLLSISMFPPPLIFLSKLGNVFGQGEKFQKLEPSSRILLGTHKLCKWAASPGEVGGEAVGRGRAWGKLTKEAAALYPFQSLSGKGNSRY